MAGLRGVRRWILERYGWLWDGKHPFRPRGSRKAKEHQRWLVSLTR